MEFGAKLTLLRQIPYFGFLPEPELRALATGLRERHYRAGDVIFRKGDQSEGLADPVLSVPVCIQRSGTDSSAEAALRAQCQQVRTGIV